MRLRVIERKINQFKNINSAFKIVLHPEPHQKNFIAARVYKINFYYKTSLSIYIKEAANS